MVSLFIKCVAFTGGFIALTIAFIIGYAIYLNIVKKRAAKQEMQNMANNGAIQGGNSSGDVESQQQGPQPSYGGELADSNQQQKYRNMTETHYGGSPADGLQSSYPNTMAPAHYGGDLTDSQQLKYPNTTMAQNSF